MHPSRPGGSQAKAGTNRGALPYRTLNEVLHDAFGLAASNSNVALCDRSETGQGMMKIATFNVNGVNGRLPVLLRWLEQAKPDVVCLQELKAPDEKFPQPRSESRLRRDLAWPEELERRRHPGARRRRRSRPGAACPAIPRTRRAATSRRRSTASLIGCLYLPNGNPAPGPKFDYKLRWFERLTAHAAELLGARRAGGAGRRLQRHADRARRLQARALARRRAVPARGARGVPRAWSRRAGPTRCATLHPDERIYTFWDYFRNAWPAMPACASITCCSAPPSPKRLVAAGVDREVRGWEKASDHAPAWIELAARTTASAPTARHARTIA